MDNGLCQMEGLCQNFFHPRNQILNQDLCQDPDSTLDQTFDASINEVIPVVESPVNRLIRERLRWVQTPDESNPADLAVQGFQQLLNVNCVNANLTTQAAPPAAPSLSASRSFSASRSVSTAPFPADAPSTAPSAPSTSPTTAPSFSPPESFSPSSSPRNTQTRLKVHEQVQLESIWKKQVEKTNIRTNLFGGRGIPSTELSVNQVRLGRA